MSPATPPTVRRDHLDGAAVMLLVGCCLVWGLGQVAAKVALTSIPPLLQAGVRSLGAAALLLAWSAWRGVRLFDRDGTLRPGLLAGVLFAGEFAAIFLGLQFTAASRLTTFVYLAPFVVAIGMPLVAPGERLRAAQWIGLCAAFGGVAMALSEGWQSPAAGPRQGWGDALAVLGALLWGATTLVIRGSRLAAASAEKTLLYQLAVCGLALCGLGLATGERWPARMETLALASLAFQTVVIAFASFLLWFWLMGRYPATRLASFTLLTPVSGLVFGVLLLGEPMTWPLGVAVAGVAAGLWLVNRR
jgi:drug/metabolite transporter (DMT)-like permease